MVTSMISLFRSFRDDIALQRRRAWWRLLFAFSVVKLLAFVVVIALIAVALSHMPPGQSGGTGTDPVRMLLSSGFSAIFVLQLSSFALGTVAVGTYGWVAATTAYVRALMGAAQARDPQLTHAVTILPVAGASAGAAGQSAIGPLAHPMRALATRDAIYLLGALAAIGMFGVGVALTIISLTPNRSFHQPISLALWLQWLFFPGSLMLLGIGIALYALTARRFARMERAAMLAQVDDNGVTFRREGSAGSAHRLRWSDALAFVRINYTDELGRIHEVFALSAADEEYLWAAMYALPNASTEEQAREESWRVAAHQLVAVVAQRTELPLLDLTPAITRTVATVARPYAQTTWGLFVRARAIALRDGDTALARERAQRQRQFTGALLLPLMRWATRLGGMNAVSAAQRTDTLLLVRELLPYYPTPEQVTPNAGRRRLIQGYWTSEYTLQWVMVALAFANALSFLFLTS